jgi:formylglycine-generating enzyme required for sulfatase activity
MGEAADDKFVTDTERPAHRVRIARRFALGRMPVTVGAYREFAPGHAPGEDPDWPVVQVSWDEARAYCAWLARGTGEPFRLPTEAEWEYACRAGSRTPFAVGAELGLGAANFLYSEEGNRVGPGARTPVGRYPANAFGLHDLHGNVCEWVEDAWHPGYAGAPADGSAWTDPDGGDRRVIRGGAWDYLPRLLRSAWRDSLPRGRRRDNVGFRVAAGRPE